VDIGGFKRSKKSCPSPTKIKYKLKQIAALIKLQFKDIGVLTSRGAGESGWGSSYILPRKKLILFIKNGVFC